MQSTKKLVLVDEFDREYKRLQRPTAAVAKANHSLSLSSTLRNSSLADDRKVRQYVEELHRYLNVNKSTDQPTSAKNWITEPERVQPRKRTVEKQKKKKRVAMLRARYSETNIDAFYSSPRAPGSFSNVRNLQLYCGRTVSEVRKFLAGQDAYRMHKTPKDSISSTQDALARHNGPLSDRSGRRLKSFPV